MQQGVRLIDLINPLLKIVKDREELYFQLLSFVSKNIDSSSIDLDHTTIINRFLPPLRAAHQTLLSREKQLLGSLNEVPEEVKVAKGASKEMIRFSSRVMQLLEASINRVRKGIFDQNGRSDREYVRFKLNLHRILKKQPFNVSQFTESILNYVTGKFQRQLGKIQKYLQKTWQGEDILLRQLYMKGSDLEGSSSPEEKTEKNQKKEPPTLKKQQLKLNIESHSNQQEQKKVRRPLKSSLKRKQKPTVRKKAKQSPRGQQSEQEQPRKVLNKQQMANKLLKFYGLLQLSRKEFLQDYMFEQIEQQKHKNELMNKLLQRNKVINSQINTYIRKSSTHIPVPLIIMPPPSKSSGDQKNQSQIPKLTGRVSFVITRRRGSFHAQTSLIQPHSDHPRELQFEDNAIKKLLPNRKKSSHSHQKPNQKSRKLYVVKQPMIFEDQMIPQAQITKTKWLQAPLTLKKEKRNENVRLKRKQNPTPLQNAELAQNFRYPS